MNEPKSLDEIRQVARDENNNNLYIAIEMLCDYIESLELANNKPQGETERTSKKKGTK